jgi:hypothetical protein
MSSNGSPDQTNGSPNGDHISTSPIDDISKMQLLDFQTRHFLYMIRRMMPYNKTERTQVDLETEAYNIGVKLSELKSQSIQKLSSSKGAGAEALCDDMISHLQSIAPNIPMQ